MEKDEIEKKKLNISQDNQNNNKYIQNKEINPSVFIIKNKENINLNDIENNNNNDNISLVKKIIYNVDDKKTALNNENNIEIKKFNKLNCENNSHSRINSRDSNDKKKISKQNNRYQSFDNDDEDISEKINNFSEKKDLQEKPLCKQDQEKEKYNLEEINQSSEIRKIMLRNSHQNIQISYIQEQNQTNNAMNNKKTQKYEIDFIKIYSPLKKTIEKTRFFIILFAIGIFLSVTTIVFCSVLQLYGNQDVYIFLSALSFLVIGLYIFGIYTILKYKEKVLTIIKRNDDPEKTNHSKQKKYLNLFLYLLIIAANYYYVMILVNTSFLNNIKLSIRGKGYNKMQWSEYFQEKNYLEILHSFEIINIFFLIFGWLNWLIMIFIIIFIIYLFFNFRLIKSIIQILCITSIQAGIFQIYLSIYCYRFRDVTSLEGVKLSWVTPGIICIGCIAIILGFFGFYVFFVENKKKIFFFEIFCIIQVILLLIFTGGLSAIGDKFYNYKEATCNSLFKFVSEDYLLKYKNNICSTKYLFTYETLDNFYCPKDRIMINWEATERNIKNSNNNENINSNNLNSNQEAQFKLSFGCINQSCCLQIYFDIKNKFDFLLILCIQQIVHFLFIFIVGIYINSKTNSYLDEEISEKKNILIIFILTCFIYVIVLPFLLTLPKESNQSIFNKIKNIAAPEDSSIIQRDLTQSNKMQLYLYTNNTFNSVKNDMINNFKYNIIFEYLNEEENNYKLSYYEYILTSSDLDIIGDLSKLENINYIDYEKRNIMDSTNIKFKSKINIINNIFDYFNLVPIHPLKNKILFNIEVNAIFIIKNDQNESDEQNNINLKYKNITILKNEIASNYNGSTQKSIISLLNEELDLSIMDKNKFFYLRGNVNNDYGDSLINLYNYNYNKAPIYSVRTDSNGSFIIGPLYQLGNNQIYYLNVEISKYIVENITIDHNGEKMIEEVYSEDTNYCKFYDLIKFSSFGYDSNEFFSLNKIELPLLTSGSMSLSGKIENYNKKNEPVKDVYVKLYYGEDINVVNEYLENNQNDISMNSFDNLAITRTSTNKEGKYSLYINNNGQYMIVFIKDEYFLEKYTFTISNIKTSTHLELGTLPLISLFNSGKIAVRLYWDTKPPDLDLVCRFEVKKNLYCYTFFGNKKCVSSEYFLDSREPNVISSEIIEISEFSEYVYLFYVRKYFDNSNGKTLNENKKDGVEVGEYKNYTDLSIKYNEYLNNSMAKLLVYSNGFKVPALKISIPGFIKNSDNDNSNEFKYWAAFCINGKKGINSLKVVNQMMKTEPPKDICLSYYN